MGNLAALRPGLIDTCPVRRRSPLRRTSRTMDWMSRSDDGSPVSLLADVHEAITSGNTSALEEWGDVLGWVEGAPPDTADPDRPDRLLGVAEVMARTGLGRTTLWNVQLTTGRVAWRESDVSAWIASRPTR